MLGAGFLANIRVLLRNIERLVEQLRILAL